MCSVSSNIGLNFLETSWKYLVLRKIADNACVDGLTDKFFQLRYNIRQLYPLSASESLKILSTVSQSSIMACYNFNLLQGATKLLRNI